jgi:nitric oxide reductase NorE protein
MEAAEDRVEHLPVETGVWIVVLGELSLFTLFFVTFLYYRALSPEVFEVSSALLNRDLGALNTLLLLASSWCVASAATALGAVDERRRVLAYLTGAIACGIAFVFIKIFEYSGVVASGINVATDEFFMFYFMLTGIHLMHLVVGLVLLVAITLHLRRATPQGRAINAELVGFAFCFWHMIDIVWIVLFPLFYLLH